MVLAQSIFFVAASTLALVTNAAPLEKRIAQVIADSTKKWVDACTAAGGGEKCGTTSQTAFMTLLAAAGDCDQQNAADAMVDLAKSLNNNSKMISLAQIFVQQPRNSPDKLSVNYCQQQPRNAELQGLFQCQFQGVDPKTFTKNVKVGEKATIPLGLNAPLNPPGSCKAHPQGGIPDGSQLVDLTEDPGVGSNAGASQAGSTNNAPDSGLSTGNTTSPAAADTSGTDSGKSTSTEEPNTAANAGGNGDFKLQNGKDAQAQNAKFASLSDSSPCTDGEQACVNGGFAQCVGGKFATTLCAQGTKCFALPLVNKPGTSIACTTENDAKSRFDDSGVTGGATGQ